MKKGLGFDWTEKARMNTVISQQARTCLLEPCTAKLMPSELLDVTVTQIDRAACSLDITSSTCAELYLETTLERPKHRRGKIPEESEMPKHDAI